MATFSRCLSEDARDIWFAGVAAAHGGRRVRQALAWDGDTLIIGRSRFPISGLRSILIVGAGKAAAAMTEGTLQSLQEKCARHAIPIHGQIHVPQTHDVAPPYQACIDVRPVRPQASNLPTTQAVQATLRMRELLRNMPPGELCIALISGGGSALLCQPVGQVPLADQVATIRVLSDNGADIRQLNTVRGCLDQIKSGGLARACRGEMVALVLSDVIGDDLAAIASGPTWRSPARFDLARQVIADWDPDQRIPAAVRDFLRQASRRVAPPTEPTQKQPSVPHTVIGNTATAVQGAVARARALGYDVIQEVARPPESLPSKAAELVNRLVGCQRPTCLISGGEPVMPLLPAERRGRGGRNLQLVLSSLRHWVRIPAAKGQAFCWLSGGTDGEDGNLSVAGGWCDLQTLKRVQQHSAPWSDYLDRQDAGTLLEATDNLLIARQTHTNVCDLRVYIHAGNHAAT